MQEAVRLYNVPTKTVWRWVAGVVTIECKPWKVRI